ncbi:ATP-binding protein, partial [Pseudomonadota bacterium]
VLNRTRIALTSDEYVIGHDGKRALIAFESLELGGAHLNVVTEFPVEEAFSSFFNTAVIIAVFMVLTLLSAVALELMLIRRFVKPIEALASAAQDAGNGKALRRSDYTDDEIGGLANALDNMTANLSASIEAAQREKSFIQDTIESLYYPFVVYNASDRQVLFSNSAARVNHENAGQEEAVSLKDTYKICISDPRTLDKVIETRKPVVIEYTECASHCLPGNYEVHGYPVFDELGEVVRVIEYIVDITEKKVLEAQLRQAQKLEALGSLAGGVAHDFNNLLSSIMGYSELALEQVDGECELKDDITSIYDAGRRGATLTKQLLAFSRKQELECVVVNFNHIVSDIEKILWTMIGDNIQMEVSLEEHLHNISADTGQMDQVIMNLAVNARDAMPKGGTLKIETANVALDGEVSELNEGIEPGVYVMLQVSDTGKGISSEIRDKIFDPFFTTKGSNGTGLGLATVYGIVKQHEGFIDISSEVGKGTAFAIYLPVSNQGDVLDIPNKPAEAVELTGDETVLLVDDDEQIVDLLGQVIEKLGYKVHCATSGESAIEICKANKDAIDLLLTDVVMPGVDGVEVAECFKRSMNNGKVMFMSGYAPELISRRGAVASGANFIQKPVRFSYVGRQIRAVLDEA